jgi:hypothetical protein
LTPKKVDFLHHFPGGGEDGLGTGRLPEIAVETLFFLAPPGQTGGDLSVIHKIILPFFPPEVNENQKKI